MRLVGAHLGSRYRADLAVRVRLGAVSARDTGRTERKRAVTAVSSSRWAGAITRTSEDQYQLGLRALRAEVELLNRATRVITRRLAVPCGQRVSGVRGYPTQTERFSKQQRLQRLTGRLDTARARLVAGQPAIVVGGRRLLHNRHHLDQAGITEQQWRQGWDAARMFLTADGESGAPHGNYTVTVDPVDGSVTIVLPEPLRHLANAPRGRYRLVFAVAFHHRAEEWLDRVSANRAVRYDITHDAARDRWYLDASWSAPATAQPTPGELAGERLIGVDLNAGHLAACVIDAHGNPIGTPHTVPLDLTGPTATRDGMLRTAITHLINLAKTHGCAGIAIENLGFADTRATGRETMGRARRGKAFRRAVAGIPTARFRDRLAGMAYHAGLVVIAVDPAYTSRWGAQHWQAPSKPSTTRRPGITPHPSSSHDAPTVTLRGVGQVCPARDQRIVSGELPSRPRSVSWAHGEQRPRPGHRAPHPWIRRGDAPARHRLPEPRRPSARHPDNHVRNQVNWSPLVKVHLGTVRLSSVARSIRGRRPVRSRPRRLPPWAGSSSSC